MSAQFITVKTVTAPAFLDCNSMLTPRLQLVVLYTKGGVSWINGQQFTRGYEISVRHDRKSDQGFTSMLIDGKGNPTAAIEPASRFSAKRLQQIVDDVLAGKHDEIVAKLYAKAKANRAEYAWPESILPLREVDGISESSLHAAVVSVVESGVAS